MDADWEEVILNYDNPCLDYFNTIDIICKTNDEQKIYIDLLNKTLEISSSESGLIVWCDEIPFIISHLIENSNIYYNRGIITSPIIQRAYETKKILVQNSGLPYKYDIITVRTSAHFPIVYGDKVVGLLIVANAPQYNSSIAEKIYAIVKLMQLTYRIRNQLNLALTKDRLYLSSCDEINNMDSFILRNSKHIGGIFNKDGKLISCSLTYENEFKKILDNIPRNIEDFMKHVEFKIIYSHFDKIINSPTCEITTHEIYVSGRNITKSYEINYKPIYVRTSSMPIAVYITIYDITARKKIEHELKTTKESLQSLIANRNLQLCKISDELINPLDAIHGASQLIELSVENGEDVEREWLKTIANSANTMLTLLREMAELVRTSSKRDNVLMEDVYVTPSIKDVVNMLQTECEKKNLTVKLDFIQDGYIVRADAYRFQQVLINVISNAIKYNKNDGEIIIKYNKMSDMLNIIIEDKGIGISRENIKLVGDPFNRLGMDQTDIKGSGLGMAITKKYLAEMNGHLNIDSEIGKGTTVVVSLPLSPNYEEISCSSQIIVMGIRGISESNKNILYIEDNPSNYRLIRAIVERRMGYNLTIATHGSQGIEFAQSLKPKVIVLDIGLPDMDGFEVFRQLKTHELTRNIPVIVYSASINPNMSMKLQDLGAEKYLPKPVDILLLEAEIQKLINR